MISIQRLPKKNFFCFNYHHYCKMPFQVFSYHQQLIIFILNLIFPLQSSKYYWHTTNSCQGPLTSAFYVILSTHKILICKENDVTKHRREMVLGQNKSHTSKADSPQSYIFYVQIIDQYRLSKSKPRTHFNLDNSESQHSGV